MSFVFTESQHDAVSRIADFDRVFAVREDGTVDSANPYHYCAPEAIEPAPYATELDGWQLPLSGFTGQDRYTGPWLHDSEVIAGGVADYVLAHPGYWVAIYAQYDCQECAGARSIWNDCQTEELPCPADYCEPGEMFEEGWTMAFKPFGVTVSHA